MESFPKNMGWKVTAHFHLRDEKDFRFYNRFYNTRQVGLKKALEIRSVERSKPPKSGAKEIEHTFLNTSKAPASEVDEDETFDSIDDFVVYSSGISSSKRIGAEEIMFYDRERAKDEDEVEWPTVGCYVKVNFNLEVGSSTEPCGSKWYYGRIEAVHKDRGVVMIQYDDGELLEGKFPGTDKNDFKVVTKEEYMS